MGGTVTDHAVPFKEGSPELYASAACQAAQAPLVCSKEALAYVMRQVTNPLLGNVIGLAATIALLATALAVARLRGWDPAWAASWRHAWSEATYRLGGTWAEFVDWIRSA